MKFLSRQGYMQSQSDWRDIEMTAYIRPNHVSEDTHFTWYSHGGHHSDQNPCEGLQSKLQLHHLVSQEKVVMYRM